MPIYHRDDLLSLGFLFFVFNEAIYIRLDKTLAADGTRKQRTIFRLRELQCVCGIDLARDFIARGSKRTDFA